VNCSKVHGEFAPEFRAQIPGEATIKVSPGGRGHLADRRICTITYPGGAMNTRFVYTKACSDVGAD